MAFDLRIIAVGVVGGFVLLKILSSHKFSSYSTRREAGRKGASGFNKLNRLETKANSLQMAVNRETDTKKREHAAKELERTLSKIERQKHSLEGAVRKA